MSRPNPKLYQLYLRHKDGREEFISNHSGYTIHRASYRLGTRAKRADATIFYVCPEPDEELQQVNTGRQQHRTPRPVKA